MSKFIDHNERDGLAGYVKVERIFKDGRREIVADDKNLVLNESANILRDLMFGDDSQRISKMQFGDMGLTSANDVQNVQAPQPTDTVLINKVFEKAVSQIQGTYNGYPAIIYTVTLLETECNGPSGTQLITEYSLANVNNNLFTRKTRAAIYKDNESSLQFTWTLVFS